ncbi:MAG: hypothetical protein K6C10_11190 [Prevotella sp.]|nr:hypothetical protein [Prevotella sp.]
MKKIYNTPKVIIRRVSMGRIMQQISFVNTPDSDYGWDQQEAKDGDNLWNVSGGNVWED